MNRPIGVFDSGLGGLTVVKEIMRLLPGEDVVYLGDTARVPYGTKSEETVTRFSIENVLFLLKHDVKMIVIACNTASSLALPFLSKNFSVPIVGVIEPGIKAGVRMTRNNRIGVIGTSATVHSASYEKQIKALDGGIKVFSKSCPLFVPLVEEGWLEGKLVLDIIRTYLTDMLKKNIDTLILGCTHYPLLKDAIKKVAGPRVNLVDSALCLAEEVRELLGKKGYLRGKNCNKCTCQYFVTDEPGKFVDLGRRFLGKKITCVKKEDITF